MNTNYNSWEQSGFYQSHLFIHMSLKLSDLFEGTVCVCIVIPGFQHTVNSLQYLLNVLEFGSSLLSQIADIVSLVLGIQFWIYSLGHNPVLLSFIAHCGRFLTVCAFTLHSEQISVGMSLPVCSHLITICLPTLQSYSFPKTSCTLSEFVYLHQRVRGFLKASCTSSEFVYLHYRVTGSPKTSCTSLEFVYLHHRVTGSPKTSCFKKHEMTFQDQSIRQHYLNSKYIRIAQSWVSFITFLCVFQSKFIRKFMFAQPLKTITL